MCGIIGYLAKGNREISHAQFERAVDALTHRGPDRRGVWNEPGVSLGFRRLSILDLEGGNQPMTNEDGSLQIVFNGEIYNFAELRERLVNRGHQFKTRSDTEVILHLYEEDGERCVESLRGMFAFAIYHRDSRRLFLARDRLGKKPLVYCETPSGFYFASEMGALLQLSDGSREVSLQAVDAYLSLNYVPGAQTIWKGIQRLPAAHILRVDGGTGTTPKRYWKLEWAPESQDKIPPIEETQLRFREVLEESVRLRMVADVPLGAFLSGGVDSSAIVAAMTRAGARVKTFCLGFTDARFNEAPHARKIAQILGTEHHEAILAPDSLELVDPLLDNLAEPFADQSLIPTYLLSHFTRLHVTVALSGDGGDELFAGYKRYGHLARADFLSRWGLVQPWLAASKTFFKLEQIFNSSRRSLRWPRTSIDRIAGREFVDQYLGLAGCWDSESLRWLWRKPPQESLAVSYLSASLAQHSHLRGWGMCQALDTDTYLVDDIMRKVDAASMACSLECRCPLLDHKVAEFAASLPRDTSPAWKGRTKALLRNLYPEILPPQTFDREKKGFSMPIGSWMRKQWKPAFQAVVEVPQSGGMEILFNREMVRRLWQEHQAGQNDHSQKLWAWYILCRWNERFKPTWPA